MSPLSSCKEALSRRVKGNKVSSTGITGHSRASSEVSYTNETCASFDPKMDGNVYKRRRLQSNIVSPLLEASIAGSTKGKSADHCIESSGGNSSVVPDPCLGRAPSTIIEDFNGAENNANSSVYESHHLEKRSEIFSLQIIANGNLEPVQNVSLHVGEAKGPEESSLCTLPNSASAHYCRRIASSSFSRSNMGLNATSMKVDGEESGKSSTSESTVAKLPRKFTSVKKLNISVLKSRGLLGRVLATAACASSEIMGDANCSLPCENCGSMENPSKMLICDLCEVAFHVSCSHPKVKKPRFDEGSEWYCQSCLSKIPKCVQKGWDGKSSETHPENYGHYTSKARIGRYFQAEVPDWFGPISDDCNYFDEDVELGPPDTLNTWNASKPAVISNWLQCREVIYKDKNDDEGTVCGKWRRAPLFETQTDDWDCSCAVVWDTTHADCAVPQELETSIVLKHLKHVEKWRNLLAKKQKAVQS